LKGNEALPPSPLDKMVDITLCMCISAEGGGELSTRRPYSERRRFGVVDEDDGEY
jgi:hypothetical protein